MQTKPIQQTNTDKRSKVALKAFFNLCEQWNLNNEQQIVLLGSPSKTTFYRWKKGEVKELSIDTIERISYLLGIYKALHIIFSDPKQANTWFYRDNQASLFAGRSALNFMLQGNMINLFEVRRYLDGWRG